MTLGLTALVGSNPTASATPTRSRHRGDPASGAVPSTAVTRRAMAVLLLMAVVAAACTPFGDVDDLDGGEELLPTVTSTPVERPRSPGEVDEPELTRTDCDPAVAEVDRRIRCAFLVVPEDRADPAGPIVEIAVAVLPATGDVRGATPVVVLPEGPEGGGLAAAEAWAEHPLRATRDLVLVDLRGSGASFPSLACPGVAELAATTVAACRARLVEEGIDLADYTAAAAAADVADLAVALRLGEYNLLGTGWGARVALTVLRDRPEGLRSLVLDSAAPPEVDEWNELPLNAQAAVNRLADACALQEDCADRFPELAARFETALRGLDLAPADLPDGGEVTGTDLVTMILAALAAPDAPREIPYAMALICEGEVAEAVAVLDQAAPEGSLPSPLGPVHGARLSTACHDEAPFNNAEVARGAGAAGKVGQVLAEQVVALFAACATWGAGEAGPVEDQPISARVPTLFLNGEFDPFTPPVWAALAASRIDRATVVEVPGAGHAVARASTCVEELVVEFLTFPSARVDDACVTEAEPLDFRLG